MTREEAMRLVAPGERLDDLSPGGMYILQRPDGFRFGMDAVLLAWFAAERVKYQKPPLRAADLGTGTGILPLLICSRKEGIGFDAIEIQPDAADMAARSVKICGMEQRISVYAMDLRDAPTHLGHEKYRLVVANPPYGKPNELISANSRKATARHESTADISDFCRVAFSLLHNAGRFCVIFPAYRMLELMDAMKAARLSPKHVLMIHPDCERPPNLVLIEAQKGVKEGLHFLKPLFIREPNGAETEALGRIYRRANEQKD